MDQSFTSSNRRIPLILTAIFLVLAASACHENADQAQLPSETLPVSVAGPQKIETVVTRAEQVARPVEASGSTQPVRAANLTPETQGLIVEIPVDEGDQVEEGQLLVRLNARMSQLQAAQARAMASASRVQSEQLTEDAERLSRLAEAGALPRTKAQQIRAQRDAVRSQRQAAEAAASLAGHVARSSLMRAPFAGTISSVMMEVGEYASMMPPRPIIRLIDLSRVEIRVRVPERDLVRISTGDRAAAHIPSMDEEREGRVTFVGMEIHPLTRTAEVVTELDNADGRLRGGLFAEVTLHPTSSDPVVLLPRASLGGTGDSRWVYAVDGCRLSRRPVEVRSFDEDRVEVVNGLEAGVRVVSRGVRGLSDGATISGAPDAGCGDAVAQRAVERDEAVQ